MGSSSSYFFYCCGIQHVNKALPFCHRLHGKTLEPLLDVAVAVHGKERLARGVGTKLPGTYTTCNGSSIGKPLHRNCSPREVSLLHLRGIFAAQALLELRVRTLPQGWTLPRRQRAHVRKEASLSFSEEGNVTGITLDDLHVACEHRLHCILRQSKPAEPKDINERGRCEQGEG